MEGLHIYLLNHLLSDNAFFHPSIVLLAAFRRIKTDFPKEGFNNMLFLSITLLQFISYATNIVYTYNILFPHSSTCTLSIYLK